MTKKKKTCCSAVEGESDSTIADELIALGHDADKEWILIDSYEVDYDTDEDENKELQVIAAHELASTGSARPNASSEQDALIDGNYFITRYVYAGEFRHDNMREFCRKMLRANKLYRKEDIVAMENKAVNPEIGRAHV